MGGGKIDIYLDIASLFSYVAFADLYPNLDKLKANGVTVDFHPVFLGGINHASGNKPSWSLEAKARYLTFDSARAVRRVGLTNIKSPDDMFAFGHTVSPLRALHYIKANYSEQVFLATLAYFLYKHWTPPNTKLADEDALRATLEEATEIKPSGGGSDDGRKLFTKDDVKEIMDGRAAMKDALKNETQDALDKGAFGAPWLWVTNSKGESEPFFGSDRFNHVYQFLGINFNDVAVLAPSNSSKL